MRRGRRERTLNFLIRTKDIGDFYPKSDRSEIVEVIKDCARRAKEMNPESKYVIYHKPQMRELPTLLQGEQGQDGERP